MQKWLIAAALAAFGLTLAGPFHFDDFLLFSDAAIASPGGWLEVWRPVQTRPLTWFTFWTNFHTAGSTAWMWHAVNLALHAACALLLFAVLQRFVDRNLALTAALIFAVHPIGTEPVAYVFARGTLLCTMFSLLTLLEWADGRDYWALAAFACALLAKEECAAVPLVLWFIRRKGTAPFFALSLAAGLRVIWASGQVRGAGAAFGAAVSPFEYASWQGLAILRYVRLLVIPWGYSVDPALSGPRVLGWLAVAALVAATIYYRSNWGRWAFAGLILLAPSSSIFPANDLAADRRMYLPMIAFSVVLAIFVRRWRVPVTLALAAISVYYSTIWMTDRSLWAEAAARAPEKSRPKVWLARQMPPAEALPILESAAVRDGAVDSELGRVYIELGRKEEALSAFERALAAAPRDPSAINNRGVAQELMGRTEAAIADFRRAHETDACFFEARRNLFRHGIRTAAQGCRYTPAQLAQLGENREHGR